MSTLESLIRLHKWQLDERRRDLATLEELAQKLAEERRKLDAEDAREQQAAAASPEAAWSYAGYAKGVIDRRQKLAQSTAETLLQIARAREALSEAFQEMKRYEIAEDNRLRLAAQREQKRQQRVLDDLGTEAYRRKGAAAE
jgi:flagellar export protein FliJ